MMPRDVIMLSDDQFNKLVELLTPGYELAKAYLASMKPAEPVATTLEAEETETSADDASQAGGA